MTIEIADRLIKLRKEHGYSQEELADKLGLSRQAVSKWERAEASPDTDNLICLAKLYGVSLDELLSTEEDLDTIVNEQVKHEEEPEVEVMEEKDTIRITDDEGNKVIINDKGVVCEDADGKCVKKKPHYDKFTSVLNIIEGALFLSALIAFLLVGSLAHAWYWAWILFFVPEIICSLVRAIHKKNPHHFNMAFMATFTFFFVCLVFPGPEANLWHPMWVVFLLIPLYYMIVSMIRKIIRKEGSEEEDND